MASPISLISDTNLSVDFRTIKDPLNYWGIGNKTINITEYGYSPIIEGGNLIKYLYVSYTLKKIDAIISAYRLKSIRWYHLNRNLAKFKNSINFISVKIIDDTTFVKINDIIVDLRKNLQDTNKTNKTIKIKKILKKQSQEKYSSYWSTFKTKPYTILSN